MREIKVILEKDKWILETSGYSGEFCIREAEKLLAFLRAKGIKLESFDIKRKDDVTEVRDVALQRT